MRLSARRERSPRQFPLIMSRPRGMCGLRKLREGMSCGGDRAGRIKRGEADDKGAAMLDLLIIGAGPAGLMAGYTAAKNGRRCSIVDMKRDIPVARRACSAQFVLDDGYEGETLKIGDGKLVFTKNGFEVPYTGKLVPIQHNYMISPKGYRVSFSYEDLRPTAMKFDKNALLKGLLEQCEGAGVEIRTGNHGPEGDAKPEAPCEAACEGWYNSEYELEARKLIIAEGVNRKLTACSA